MVGSKAFVQERHTKRTVFFQLAGALALRVTDRRSYYLEWSKREWSWFQHSGMINAAGIINDGLTPHCRNNGGFVWSYNQGVILGGLCNLWLLERDVSYLLWARDITLAALRNLTVSDVLTDPCPGDCTGSADLPQFKGVFLRNTMYVYDAIQLYLRDPDPPHAKELRALNTALAGFAADNAQAICSHNCVRSSATDRTYLGFYWAGPFERCDAARQSSAAEALIAELRTKS